MNIVTLVIFYPIRATAQRFAPHHRGAIAARRGGLLPDTSARSAVRNSLRRAAGEEICPRRGDRDRISDFCTLFSPFPAPSAGCRECPSCISAGQRLAPAKTPTEAVRKSPNSCPYPPLGRDFSPTARSRPPSHRAARGFPDTSARSAVRNSLRRAAPRPTAPLAHNRRFPRYRRPVRAAAMEFLRKADGSCALR